MGLVAWERRGSLRNAGDAGAVKAVMGGQRDRCLDEMVVGMDHSDGAVDGRCCVGCCSGGSSCCCCSAPDAFGGALTP